MSNTSPHLFVLSSFSTAIISFLVFTNTGAHYTYFFMPILGLAILYGTINMLRQKKGLSRFSLQKNIKLGRLLRQSIARYAVWLVIIYMGRQFYETMPIYNTSKAFLDLFDRLFKFYMVLGPPYFFITLIFKSSSVEDFYDPAIRIIHILKQTALRLTKVKKTGSIMSVFNNRYNKKVLLNIVMRAYFIPIMAVQVYTNIDNAIRHSQSSFYGYNFFAVISWITAILWLTDTINASLSYCIESRWVENRSLSIDMTFGGWLVCLSVYYPLNQATGTLFKFAPFVAYEHPESLLFSGTAFIYSLKIIEMIILIFHVYAATSLGPSVANISLKKLQTRGLYGIIRHPGTVLKLLLWWTQSVFYGGFWSVGYIFGHLAWNLIYILRALTEERHLSNYEEYRLYKRKVRYRFIPGVI